MTMLDDDRLASLFARAGAAFEVPATGADDIVARASRARDDGRPTGRRPRAPRTRSTRDERRRRRLAPVGAITCTARGRRRPAPRPLGRRLHRRRAGARRRRRGAGAQPGTPDRHGRAVRTPRVKAPAPRRPRPRPPPGPAASRWRPAARSPPRPSGAARLGTRARPTRSRRQLRTPSLPSGAVGQSARIEQTGTLGLTVGRGRLEPDYDAVDAPWPVPTAASWRTRRPSRARRHALRQHHPPGAGGQLLGACSSRPRRSGRPRTSPRRPPTSRASTSTCRRASPRSRPAASST